MPVDPPKVESEHPESHVEPDHPELTSNQLPTLDDIDSAPPAIPPSRGDYAVTTEDYAIKLARVTAEKDELYFENQKLKMNAETAKTLNELIKPYASRAFWFMCCYSAGVFGLLLLTGFGKCGFTLPDSTLDYLVGSTAVTVIGLVGMVLTGIFVGARK